MKEHRDSIGGMKKAVKKSKSKSSRVSDPQSSRRFDTIDKKLDRVIGAMVTRSEFDDKTDRIIDAMVTRQEFSEYKKETSDRLEKLEHSLERLTTAVDKLRKSVDDLLIEYAVIAKQLSRHDRWFKEISDKIGIDLKP